MKIIIINVRIDDDDDVSRPHDAIILAQFDRGRSRDRGETSGVSAGVVRDAPRREWHL